MKSRYIILLLAGTMALWGCGGGGGNGGPSGGSKVVSKGAITGFGSVFVNGVEFETTGATFSSDGDSIRESDLRLGMVVTVSGSSDGTHGSATSIDFSDNLEGPIDSIDVPNNSLVVMGQTVKVDSSTKFHDTPGLSSLAVGNIVEVSGMPDATGAIVATYIEFEAAAFAPGMEIELKGTVSALDTILKTFKIGGLTVDYSGAVLEDLPSGLSDGLYAEVKSTQAITANVIIASAIEKETSSLTGQAGTKAEIEGFITEMNGDTLKVGGQQVRITSSTVYENGSAAGIALNKKIEVHGTLDASGVLVADRVSFENS